MQLHMRSVRLPDSSCRLVNIAMPNNGIRNIPVLQLADDLAQGCNTAENLARSCLEQISNPAGEGARAFIEVDEEKILDQARASDLLRHHAIAPTALAGIPVSVKDLFDVAGEVTRAGSKVLAEAPPAKRDAPAIARLRAAGAVLTGRTNMTEFAYSGVGLNPHYGTPANPWDRTTGRIPGGSSSGGAVSVMDGMAALAIGTDTGGSCRIPAALCGLVGFKPTATRIPLYGCYPLSPSQDSIGAMGNSVSCVALADSIMAGEEFSAPVAGPVSHLHLAMSETMFFDNIDEGVARAFEAALGALRDGGAQIDTITLAEIEQLPALADRGGIVGVEANAHHRDMIGLHGEDYDPRVRVRIELAGTVTGDEYLNFLSLRRELIAGFAERIAPYDALILPTVPIIAPPFSAFEDDEAYFRLNRLLLRNPGCFNALDCCAITLPCHEPGDAPVGLMLASVAGRDRQLFNVAASVESGLAHRFG